VHSLNNPRREQCGRNYPPHFSRALTPQILPPLITTPLQKTRQFTELRRNELRNATCKRLLSHVETPPRTQIKRRLRDSFRDKSHMPIHLRLISRAAILHSHSNVKLNRDVKRRTLFSRCAIRETWCGVTSINVQKVIQRCSKRRCAKATRRNRSRKG